MVGQYLRVNSGIRNVGRHHMPEAGDGKTLEQRIRAIEDRLEIYNLIASHPPSADTGDAGWAEAAYTKDGLFDRGPGLSGAAGSKALGALLQSDGHQAAIAGGLA